MDTALCTGILRPFQQQLDGVVAELWRGCSPQVVPVANTLLPSAEEGVPPEEFEPEPEPEPEHEPEPEPVVASAEDLEHAFLDLAKDYDWAAVEQALTAQPELVDVQPRQRWSALHQAASVDDAAAVAMLLRFGADPSVRNAEGQTPRELTQSEQVTSLLDTNDGTGS